MTPMTDIMVKIESKHLLYLLDYVEELFEFSDISITDNIDTQDAIDKLSAIMAARVALNKE
jgi:hypothetical protein